MGLRRLLGLTSLFELVLIRILRPIRAFLFIGLQLLRIGKVWVDLDWSEVGYGRVFQEAGNFQYGFFTMLNFYAEEVTIDIT